MSPREHDDDGSDATLPTQLFGTCTAAGSACQNQLRRETLGGFGTQEPRSQQSPDCTSRKTNAFRGRMCVQLGPLHEDGRATNTTTSQQRQRSLPLCLGRCQTHATWTRTRMSPNCSKCFGLHRCVFHHLPSASVPMLGTLRSSIRLRFSSDKSLLVFGAFLHVVVRPFIVEASPDGVVLVVAQQCGQVRRRTHSYPARNHTVIHLCLCITSPPIIR